jgi:hypothetical protein
MASSQKTKTSKGSSGASRSGGSSKHATSHKQSSGTSRSKGSGASHRGETEHPAQENGNSSRRGLNAAEAVQQAREQLSQLLGRPVEHVLGVDRDDGNWIIAAEVVELERIPNTTDVLAEYRATLDKDGELVGFKQLRRYHRGHTGGGES